MKLTNKLLFNEALESKLDEHVIISCDKWSMLMVNVLLQKYDTLYSISIHGFGYKVVLGNMKSRHVCFMCSPLGIKLYTHNCMWPKYNE